jgi:hypothetical protein
MKLKVRKADITRGERFSLEHCPIGLAAARSFTGKEIRVGYKFISVADAESYEQYHLPGVAEQFLHDFEDGKPVEPFEIQLVKVERIRR